MEKPKVKHIQTVFTLDIEGYGIHEVWASKADKPKSTTIFQFWKDGYKLGEERTTLYINRSNATSCLITFLQQETK